jgi:hypothetical protein
MTLESLTDTALKMINEKKQSKPDAVVCQCGWCGEVVHVHHCKTLAMLTEEEKENEHLS